MNISDLNYYVLFVFKDLTNDRIVSTTDIDNLKTYTDAENFSIGQLITFLEEEYIIKDISLSKVGSKLNNDHKYGISMEGVNPQGEVKDVFFRVTISLEEQFD